MQWLAEHKDWVLALLQQVPWRKIVLSVLIGLFGGLLIGLLLTGVLHKLRLLRRNNRWLNYAVKLYWGLIPVIFILAGVQIGLIRCGWSTADGILVSNETLIRDQTRAFLGVVQTELDKLIEESPELKDASLNDLLDKAIDRALSETTEPISTSITPQEDTLVLSWLKRAAHSTIARSTIKTTLVKAAQKVSGADKTTIEMAFQKTLGQMAEDNIAYNFARERLNRLMWSFITAALLHTLPFLLIPALEISLSKWRKW